MIYFLIPIYNEEPNLELLSATLHSILPGEKKFYLFSDDGSKDGSQEKIKKLFADTEFAILGDGNNHGPGFAFNTGFEWILAHSRNPDDSVITIEADNTSNPEIMDTMLVNHRLGFSLVLASVYAQGGGFDKTSFLRKVISSGANLLLRFGFDLRVQTLSSFYRIYSVSLLRQIREKYKVLITEAGFLCMIEILVKAIKCNATIVEIPMMLKSQMRKGKSKMKKFKTMLGYLRLFLFKRFR